MITEKEAAKHPNRNVLSRNLGAKERIKPDLAKYELRSNDILLMYSDGLSDEVSNKEMATVLQAPYDKQLISSSIWPTSIAWRL